MTALLVVLLFVGFVVIDALVRLITRRMIEGRERRERALVLETSLRLESTDEAKSLRRVEVPHPRAAILAVDDEPIVLDSLRKILVLAGFNVDTVESGPEALGLVQRKDYDFVFTDLKMPGMDGVEVVKAVKHLRPDVDVAVITGYATIESAVATMQHGAMDYVQKPFTEEELVDFARRLLIKRQARLEAQRRPTVSVVAPAMAETASAHEFCVPGGAFVSGQHAWARIEPGGQVRIGLDDFARKALGPFDSVSLPERGTKVRRGDPLFAVGRGGRTIRFPSPVSGQVAASNEALAGDPGRAGHSPYDRGWFCLVQPSDLASELPALRIGKPVIAWYQDEIARLRAAAATGEIEWSKFESEFLAPPEATGAGDADRPHARTGS